MRLLRSAVLLPLVIAVACENSPTPLAPSLRPQFTGTPTTISLTKTATGYWRQSIDYSWDLQKSVSPSAAEISPSSTATLNYTLTATRQPATTSEVQGVAGQLCVTNNGTNPTTGLTVWDVLQIRVNSSWVDVQTITVDVSAKPSLQSGETFCYNYDIPFTPAAGAQYRNAGVAAITNLEGASEGQLRGVEVFVPFTLATAPTTGETDENATLTDLLTCPAGFTCSAGPGSWTLTGTQTLNYAIQVTNVSAPCSHTDVVDNTAELTEGDSGTKHNDSESVMVTTPRCEEPPPPDLQGCTPGYWKQKQHFGSWVGYTPTGTSASKYNTVFGVNLFSANTTLLTALGTGGGGIYRFGRHSTAALLSASNSGVSYGMTPAQVIAAVQAAVASGNYDAASDEFEKRNERQCPLGRAD